MANLPRIKPVVAMKCFGRVIYRPCVQNAHHGLNLGLNFNNKGKMAKLLSKYFDDALIRELNGRGYKCYDEEDGVPLDDVDEDTLIDELEGYGYFVYDEEVDPEKVWYDVDEWYKRDHFILAKDFDGRQLVDFMLDIFALPCVRSIMKRDDGTFVFKVKLKPRTYEIAHVGDTLVEMEDGTWLIDP